MEPMDLKQSLKATVLRKFLTSARFFASLRSAQNDIVSLC